METIGRLQVERLLGSGSFASVWLAYDPDLDSRVAIKVLADNWAHEPDMRARFIEEARILRRLEHSRIARVYAIGTNSKDQPYLVMEYADRGSLYDRIQARHTAGQGFSVDEAMSIGLEIAECVSVAHDLGVIHRDLKPSNILYRSVPAHHQASLRRRGFEAPAEQMVLVDFGLARKFQALSESTLAAGTPHYMAPEQAEGRADARVDVYACAAILYQLLAGEVPFPHSSIGEVIRHQLIDGAPSIIIRRPDAGSQLAAAIDSALATDPDRRPRSMVEWTDGLVAVQASFRPNPLAGLPGVAPPIPQTAVPDGTPGHRDIERIAGRVSSQPPTEVSQEPSLARHVEMPPPEPIAGADETGEPATIACNHCGERNPADFSFCGDCGATLPKLALRKECPECGESNRGDFNFCGECGHEV